MDRPTSTNYTFRYENWTTTIHIVDTHLLLVAVGDDLLERRPVEEVVLPRAERDVVEDRQAVEEGGVLEQEPEPEPEPEVEVEIVEEAEAEAEAEAVPMKAVEKPEDVAALVLEDSAATVEELEVVAEAAVVEAAAAVELVELTTADADELAAAVAEDADADAADIATSMPGCVWC